MLPIPIPLKIISYFTPSDIVALCIGVQFLLLLIVFTYLLIKGHRLDSFKFLKVKIIYPHEIKSTIIKHNESIIIMHDYFKLTTFFFVCWPFLVQNHNHEASLMIPAYQLRTTKKTKKRHYVSLTKN